MHTQSEILNCNENEPEPHISRVESPKIKYWEKKRKKQVAEGYIPYGASHINF